MSKQTTTKIMSPTCEVEWAYLSTPDTAYDKEGIYQVDLVLDVTNDDHKAFLKKLKDLLPAGAKNQPWKQDGEQKNIFRVKCKQKAVVGKFTFKPRVFDAKGTPIKDVPVIGNGSKLNVQVEVREYDMKGGGIRLNPMAIQIVELVEYVADDEDGAVSVDNPFGAVEGGFTVDTFESTVEDNAAADDEDEFDF